MQTIYYYFPLWAFFHTRVNDSLSLESEKQQLSSGLQNSSDSVAWMLLIPHLIFNSSSCLTKALETVPSVPITISITVTIILSHLKNSKMNKEFKGSNLTPFNLVYYKLQNQGALNNN